MNHDLKIKPEFLQSLKDGKKTFEIRKNDRGFQTGDFLLLRPYDAVNETYLADNSESFKVTYVLSGTQFGIIDNYVVLGVQRQ